MSKESKLIHWTNFDYRDSRQLLVQARTLTRCSRKKMP